MGPAGSVLYEGLCHGPGGTGTRNKKRLIASALPLVLRASREGKTQALCPSEANFPELYQVLGRPAAQDAIRQANPEGKHCELLKRSPTACADCPVRQNPYLGDEGRDSDHYRVNE